MPVRHHPHSTCRCPSPPHSTCRCASTWHSTRPATAGTVRGRGRHTPAPWAPGVQHQPPLASNEHEQNPCRPPHCPLHHITLSPLTLARCSIACRAHEKVAHYGHTSAPLAHQQKAWGIAGDPRAVARTITLRMTDDMRFTPRHIEVREGETVRLRARNEGQAL